jgi:hypothetical protein
MMVKSFHSWDETRISYQEWGEQDPLAVRPETLAGAIANATLKTLAGNHIEALGDPRFTRSIVDFLA